MRYLFPILMGVEAFGAGVVSLCQGDWRKAGYWFCCTAITFFVTD